MRLKLLWQGATGVVIRGSVLFDVITTPSCLVLPLGLIGLRKSCFSGQNNLEVIKFSRSIEFVDEYVFSNCINLRKVVLRGGQDKFIEAVSMGNTAEIIFDTFNKGKKLSHV